MKHSDDGKLYRYNTTLSQIKEADFTNSMNIKDEQPKDNKTDVSTIKSSKNEYRAGAKWLALSHYTPSRFK